VGACGGGGGGGGAGGSGGSGGTGGVSAGVLRKGGSLDGLPTVTHGARGMPGLGGDIGTGGVTPVLGTAPSGVAGAGGRDGIADDVVVVN
jgi:hypothetical protein